MKFQKSFPNRVKVTDVVGNSIVITQNEADKIPAGVQTALLPPPPSPKFRVSYSRGIGQYAKSFGEGYAMIVTLLKSEVPNTWVQGERTGPLVDDLSFYKDNDKIVIYFKTIQDYNYGRADGFDDVSSINSGKIEVE